MNPGGFGRSRSTLDPQGQGIASLRDAGAADDRAEPARVVHVITGLEAGGAQHMLVRLLGAPQLAGFEQAVISLRGPGPLTDAASAACATIRHVGMPRALPGPHHVWRFRNLVRKLQPDVLLGWMYHGNLAAWWGRNCLDTGCGLGWNVRHSFYGFHYERPLSRWVIRANARLSGQPDAIVYNAQRARVQHQRLGFRTDRSRYIPNAIDVDRFRPDPRRRDAARSSLGIPPDAFCCGTVARWHRGKGHVHLLEAVKSVFPDLPQARLLLVGPGCDDSNRELVALLDRLGLRDRVIVAGYQQDMAFVLDAIDVLVSPSVALEGFSNVIAEAMAMGKPCIATDVGDSAKLVATTGWIIPAGDAGRLADAVGQSASLPPAERTRLGEQARQRVLANWSLGEIAPQYAALFRDLARARA